MNRSSMSPLVAIACGGTGGHLFPGLAVAGALRERGCEIVLLVSRKEVDQQALAGVTGMRIETLPAVGLTRGGLPGFIRGFWRSFRQCNELFRVCRPDAVLAMGGFTSAPPVLAGRRFGARTFFHDSNAIPGRANRWLAHWVDEAFLGFPTAVNHLFIQRATTTGTPVRAQFRPRAAAECRVELGLDPDRPVLLTMGGSQGASAINELVIKALASVSGRHSELQYIHLTGAVDLVKVRSAYEALKLRSMVVPFLSEMEVAMNAATLAVSRAGASSLAEIAAVRLPAVVIPLPTAADNHQFFNATYFARDGAVRMLEQDAVSPGELAGTIARLIDDPPARAALGAALGPWHSPDAARRIADRIASAMGRVVETARERPGSDGAADNRGNARVARADEWGPQISIAS